MSEQSRRVNVRGTFKRMNRKAVGMAIQDDYAGFTRYLTCETVENIKGRFQEWERPF